ncbi:Crp/Fnr family transcriptional regulator [Belliella sp. DSM 107340]|uniref:Crp/Fnr family transcriptional regulator n=1 Tax=Belliella calami TaxID=2923436 RepID=A0ABS9UNM7_9BACT|nr:Crp/Fnr family transcriptional regulator [Belliella calami]MCH7398025.1 Crp/Fnr family transcriptional regulator [Belliella calami]
MKKKAMDVLSYFQSQLSKEEARQLIKEQYYKKGEYLYNPPHKPNEMFQIFEGAIKIGTYSEDGEEVCYDILYKNEVFGNLRYLNGQFFEFAKALTDCRVVSYELSFYKKMIVFDPKVSDWFNKSVIQRWCRMETRLFKICTLSPSERIKAIFKEFDDTIIDARSCKVFIPDLLHKVDISQMTGICRQTVSKLMKSMEAKAKTHRLETDLSK